MTLVFVTSNEHKFREASKISEEYGVNLEHLDTSYVEIQADSLEEIVKYSVNQVSKETKKPCFIEDSGLFIRALDGFPGPYSSYVFRTLQNEGILSLLNGVEDREAEFRSVVGYSEPDFEPKVFKGIVKGEISEEIRGSRGFGFDPIFLPRGGQKMTFAEMKAETKNNFSHRGKAIEKLVKWYVRNRRAER